MEYKLSYQRKLPHYQPKDGIFFITTRLAFDIPTVYLNAMNRYRESLRQLYEKAEDVKLAEEIIKKKCFAYEDELYTKCATSVDLAQAPAQGIIISKLLEMSKEYYYLYAFTIMPNHLHILLKPLTRDNVAFALSQIVKMIKGATAREINVSLQSQGSIWFREYYDHWVRSQQELINVIEYIRYNPVKAGYVKDPQYWPGTWLNPDIWGE